MSASYFCSHCGRQHDGLPTDWGFKLPDEVHELSYLTQYRRARHNADLCTLDEARHFIRTLLPLPLLDDGPEAFFNWGVWLEVDRATHDLYVDSWTRDISAQGDCSGRIANDITVYGGTLGLPVRIAFQPGTARPLAQLMPGTPHALALEQAKGISGKRHHDILMALGYFDGDGESSDDDGADLDDGDEAHGGGR